jgi:uncharacterized membrane protein
MTVEESVVVRRSAEEVYDLVSDLERAPEWQSSLESVDLDRRTEVRNFAGQRREASFDVTEDDRPRRFAVDSRSGRIRARAAFTLTPDGAGDGTRVALRLELDLGKGGRLAAAVIRGRVAREARQDLERLSELLQE